MKRRGTYPCGTTCTSPLRSSKTLRCRPRCLAGRLQPRAWCQVARVCPISSRQIYVGADGVLRDSRARSYAQVSKITAACPPNFQVVVDIYETDVLLSTRFVCFLSQFFLIKNKKNRMHFFFANILFYKLIFSVDISARMHDIVQRKSLTY